ncbi:hypothetical protein [Formosa maritima]|uniref:Nicotinate-nucleotide adenylyltransferase n=1 Tax=Formosa maritima TaxID=2592046 RepID=A0A5D0GN69_9FLAO|nr:hypothetical protein [Formosa maritima]TYA59147.1 hypothetical protein FVF61_03060 [Formosa maritima]
MKTVFFGLLFLGFANLSFSQSNQEIEEVKLADVVISPLNLSYLNAVQEKNTPESVRHLENKAARFDITESPVFDNQFEAYEVIFKEASKNGGQIIATYNSEGKILKSFEKFNDVTLPPSVRNAVYKEYPGWTIHSDTYLVSYYINKDTKKVYKLKIKKDDEKKTLKIDVDGKLI